MTDEQNDEVVQASARLRATVAQACEEHLLFISGLRVGDKVILTRDEVVALVARAIKGFRAIGGITK